LKKFYFIFIFFMSWAQPGPCGWAGPSRPNRPARKTKGMLTHVCLSKWKQLLFKWIIIHLSSENAKMNCMHWDEENKPGGGNDVEDDGNGVRSQWCWWRWRGSRRWLTVVMTVAGSVCCSFSSSSPCRETTSVVVFFFSSASVWFFSFWSLVGVELLVAFRRCGGGC